MYQTQQQQPEEERKPVVQKTYNYKDLLEFEDPNIYSSIGKMRTSNRQTAPSYGFGTSNRAKQAKVYQDEALSRTQFVGKTSPGPNYEVRHTDKYYYKDDPKWSFGKDVRNTLNTGAKHAYYARQDVDFDPITADNTRRWDSGKVKIGLESRFSDGPKRHKATPGPDYDPSLKPEIPKAPLYSFGVRREIKGASPLVLMASTPQQVGPGSYLRLDQGNTSTIPDHPKVGFTKEQKFRSNIPNIQRNQTYDTRSSIGQQQTSKNRTMSAISIGKARREVQTGSFKDMMATQPTRVRIQHAKY